MPTDAHAAIATALERGDYTAAPLQRFKRPITHRQGLTARLGALEHSHGGEQAAAAAAGVTTRTWRGWKRNPLARLSVKSRRSVEQAYEDDLQRRSDNPLRQLRYALAQGRETTIIIWAEIQWDGYYNGQKAKVKDPSKPGRPLRGNKASRRRVDFGQHDIEPVIRAWKNGRDTRGPMETLLSDSFGAAIFLNSYYTNASAEL